MPIALQNYIFLPVYAILKTIDNKLLCVILMLFLIFILLFSIYCNRLCKNSSANELLYLKKTVIFYLWAISIIVLGFVGACLEVPPSIKFGKIFTIIYFISYFVNYIISKHEYYWLLFILKLGGFLKNKLFNKTLTLLNVHWEVKNASDYKENEDFDISEDEDIEKENPYITYLKNYQKNKPKKKSYDLVDDELPMDMLLQGVPKEMINTLREEEKKKI